ncbi:amino acid kinase [Methanosarcina sp. KYL-1]|uniref:amino acid kinase family protein n=1 Tax=Methanosarcina sp. KYL-1 TaxID=2602068 RepID=UPI00210191C1|nr:amino acid kinase [Methanosarcina sp. KYL-1]MCQ1537279.1 amino acid kinase [Methanosarcina sp. KYL-1]
MKVVVKLGGSLIMEAPGLVSRLVKEFGPGKPESAEKGGISGRSPFSILIVPGGGMFADAVRKADETFGLGPDASHWMAVLGMEQYACYLLDKSGARGADSIKGLPPGVTVLLPYRLLRAEDPLPHSWDVTSDTIAAWAAKQTEARLVKATDVDGIFREGKLLKEVTAAELTGNGSSCIDPALPGFLLENRMECMIVNGKYPERVLRAVYGEPVPGTAVKGNI